MRVAIVALLVAVVCGCAPASTSGQPTKTATVSVDPHALAAAADKLLWDAWKASATTCLNAATANHDDTIRQRCEPILTGVRNALLTADSAVDVWDAAAQKNFPCLVSSAALGLTQFESLYSLSIPQVVRDGLTLAQSYAGKCSP